MFTSNFEKRTVLCVAFACLFWGTPSQSETIVVDLRPADSLNNNFLENLRTLVPSWKPVYERDFALTGTDLDPTVENSLRDIRKEFARGQCALVVEQGEPLLHLLAQKQAIQIPVLAPLSELSGLLFACYVNEEKFGHAQWMRQLIADHFEDRRPPHVSESVWKRFPSVDGTANRMTAKLEVLHPRSSTIWYNFTPIEATPTFVPQGPAIIAAGLGCTAKSRLLHINTWIAQVSFVGMVASPFNPAMELASSARNEKRELRPNEVSRLLLDTSASQIIEIAPDTSVRLLKPGQERVLLGTVASLSQQTTPLTLKIDKLSKRPFSPAEPTEKPSERKKWLVYGAIGTAVALAITAIVINETTEDTQRIQVSW